MATIIKKCHFCAFFENVVFFWLVSRSVFIENDCLHCRNVWQPTFGSCFSGMASKKAHMYIKIIKNMLKLNKKLSCIRQGFQVILLFWGQLFYIVCRIFGCYMGIPSATKIKRIRPFWEALKILKLPKFQAFFQKGIKNQSLRICTKKLMKIKGENWSLKVSKSQKKFILKLHCPKRNIKQNSAL